MVLILPAAALICKIGLEATQIMLSLRIAATEEVSSLSHTSVPRTFTSLKTKNSM